MNKCKYRIAPGQKHYMRVQKKPGKKGGMVCHTEGQVVELTDRQARAFRDKLVPMDQTADQLAKKETAVPPEFSLHHVGAGRYNVVNAQKKPVNEKPMPKEEAKKVMADLLAEDIKED